jgi:hypothetical protein
MLEIYESAGSAVITVTVALDSEQDNSITMEHVG